MKHVQGISASPGIAIGPGWQYRRQSLTIPCETADDPKAEEKRLMAAQEAATAELCDLIDCQQDRLSPDELAIFQAQNMMLSDPDLLAKVLAAIAEGASAEAAWWAGIRQVASDLEALSDPYFRARAADVRDVGERVLRRLLGVPAELPMPDHPVVVIAEDLMPSDTVGMEAGRVLAICTAGGGPTSHAAILARRLGMAAVVGLSESLLQVPDGTTVLVDGDAGELIIEPDQSTLDAARARQVVWRAQWADAKVASHEPALTRDGVHIEVAANVCSLEDAELAADYGADGVGLLRTEFLYLDRATAPGEDEQVAIYRPIVHALGGNPVVVRTLDIGGDKPLRYLSLPHEANPFLGVRAIRLARQYPDLLRVQLRAILRAAVGNNVRVMFPMVSNVEEVAWLHGLFGGLRDEMAAVGEPIADNLQIGIMVEIPSAALLAERFLPWVDFFSIGTNDLSQYTLAADRTNANVATMADGLHPAVLRLIRLVTEAAHGSDKWVGLCGEIAGEELAVPILIGLGVDELSVNPKQVPLIKAAVRRWSMADAQDLANQASNLDNGHAVRQLVEAASNPS